MRYSIMMFGLLLGCQSQSKDTSQDTDTASHDSADTSSTEDSGDTGSSDTGAGDTATTEDSGDTGSTDTGAGDTATTDTGAGDTGADDTGAPSGALLPANPPVTTCTTPIPAAQEGGCDITLGTTDAILLRGTVLGPANVWEQGDVLIDTTGLIACVGCGCDSATEAQGATVITCADGVISPGLINAHDHLTYDDRSPLPASTTRYEHRNEWRHALSTPNNQYGTGKTSAGTRWVEVRQVMSGTTTINGSGYAAGMARNPDKGDSPGLNLPEVEYEVFPLSDGSRSNPATNCDWNYAESELSIAAMDAYVPHVGEGINLYAHEEVRCLSTSMDGGQDEARHNVSWIHGVGLQAIDYAELVRSDTPIIWSPRSNISLYGQTADVSTFTTLGGITALGTDWTYSGSATLGRELACADTYNQNYLNHAFTDAQLWQMATYYGARALGLSGLIGEISVGAAGDIAIFDGTGIVAGTPHRAVIGANSGSTWLVLRGGEPLYGEADVITALDATCDTFTACGSNRALCTATEFGISWTDLQAAVPSAYPALICTTPPNEPTCIPSRPSEYTGIPTATDADGDGLDDASDLCPQVFSPVRAIEGLVQRDADGDSIGDACDATPIASDVDSDGILNDVDICWRDQDTGQDADSDLIGDVCDACPNVSNPNSPCLPTNVTIDVVRASADGTTVAFTGNVTAVSSGIDGLFAQDSTGQGIRVYMPNGGVSPFSLGDSIQVVGTVTTYFDEVEVNAGLVTRLGPGTPPSPVVLTATDAAVEAYEGQLVTISGTVTNLNYDCAVDAGSCSDDNLWEIGGASGVLIDDRAFKGGSSAWTASKGATQVTGVMSYRYNRRRILPRSTADFSTP